MKVKKLVATVAVFGAGFAAFSTGSTVQAEPVSNSYVVVGSDTIEDVLNALANGTAITGSTVRVTQNGATIGSFDATGGPSIITKPGGVRFSRPNGSGEGYRALSSSIYEGVTASNNFFTSGTFQPAGQLSSSTMATSLKNINIFGQVDIARSSSEDPAKKTGVTTLSTEGDTNATLVRVPFARDAFGLAFTQSLADAVCAAGQDSDTGAGCTPYLTKEQLKSLFSSTARNAGDTAGAAVIRVGTTDVPAQGVVPQVGSGTGKDFETKIVLSEAERLAAIAKGNVIYGQEHDASTMSGNQVAPMAASRWIAMKNGASFDRSGTGVVLGAIYTDVTLGKSPILGVPGSMTPNSEYYADTTWGRDTFLFVERARVTLGNAKYDANLAALVNPSLNKLANIETNGASKAGKVKEMFGLLPPLTSGLAYFVPAYVGTK